MPGYIMHLAEGRLLEPHLVQRGLLKGERALSLFQNGLLLPLSDLRTILVPLPQNLLRLLQRDSKVLTQSVRRFSVSISESPPTSTPARS